MDNFRRDTMTFVQSKETALDLLNFLSQVDWVVIDTETTGLNIWKEDTVCAIGIGNTHRQYFVDVRGVNVSVLLKHLGAVRCIVGHNIKFDLAGLEKFNYAVPDVQEIHDTIVMSRLITFERFPRLALKVLIDKYFGAGSSDYDTEFSKYLRSKKLKKFSDADVSKLGIYCMNDVYFCAKLYDYARQIIDKDLNLSKIWRQEIQVTKTVWNMEQYGVNIDREYVETSKEIFDTKCADIQTKINQAAGREINLNSNLNVGQLFSDLGIVSPVRTKTGRDSWSEEALLQIDHPVAKSIRQYRGMQNCLTKYFDVYLERETPIHPSIKNWGTVTGRFAYSNPNLQNLPKVSIEVDENVIQNDDDSEYQQAIKRLVMAGKGVVNIGSLQSYLNNVNDSTGISVRRSIIPRGNNVLLSFDYSQMEMKVLFDYIDNPEVNKMLKEGNFDGHSWVAKKAWGVTEDHPNFKAFRAIGKALNFGIIYGGGNKLLATQIGKTEEEAKKFKDDYYKQIPGIQKFGNDVRSAHAKRGYVFNKFGRLYSVEEQRSYVLVNYLIQGTSADFMKNRMCKLEEYDLFKSKIANQLLQVHDELLIECDKSVIDECVQLVKSVMEEPVLRLPLSVDCKVCYPSYANKFEYNKGEWRKLVYAG